MTSQHLSHLKELAEKHLDKELALHSEMVRRVDAIKKEMQSLRQQCDDPVAPNDVFTAARWKIWAEEKHKRLECALHVATKEADQTRDVARKSFARVKALEQLLENSKYDALMRDRRRAEQNNLPPDA